MRPDRDRATGAASGRPPDPRGTAASPAAEDSRAARALWVTLALLAAARLALTFVPNTWAWGLGLMRFLDPLVAWSTWGLMALAIVPRVARLALPALDGVGARIDRRATVLALAALVAAVVWLLPDRAWFTGDFLMRAGTVRFHKGFLTLFPQSMPLDALLHDTIPYAIAATGGPSTDAVARATGALEAGVLAALALAFARALGLSGATAVAAAAIVTFGGALTMFTGYAKSASELALLTAWAGVSAVRMVREGRGALPLGLALALAPAVHRSGLLMLPVGVVAWVLRARGEAPEPRVKRVLGILLPLAALALTAPRIVSILRGFDATFHFGSPEVRGGGGLLGTALAGTRPADLVNAVVALSPLSPALPVLVIALGRRALTRASAALLALALPLAGAMLAIHPQQGLFRDWDVFTTAGVSLSMLLACWVGTALAAPRMTWLAVAVTAGVGMPALQWLTHNQDVDRALIRVEAFLSEPPARSAVDRTSGWDYIGITEFNRDHWSAAVRGFSRAAQTAPSPRILQQWALAETMNENLRAAQALYHRLTVLVPEDRSVWLGLAAVASRIPDPADSRRAARELLRLDPGNANALQILEYLDRDFPEAPAPNGSAGHAP